MRKSLFFVVAVLVATILACGFNVSTANISDAQMTADADGNEPTTVFAQDDTFYAVVQVGNAPDDTTVKAVWVAVDADGVDPDLVIGEKELQGGGTLTYSLSNTQDTLWPVGAYKVDIYLNNELDRSLEFEVEGEVVAEAPTPEPEPTDTPEPEPTDTPVPEPTDAPEESSGESAAGDTLAQPTEAPAEEAEPLPFQPDPYVHPSGGFSFAIPEGWEVNTEDETSVTVSAPDDIATVSSMFVDVGYQLSESEMQEFNDEIISIFAAGDSEYEVLAQEQYDDEIYTQVAFELIGVGVTADFIVSQQDTVLYVLNFIAVNYDQMLPTWNAIIDSYEMDAAAVTSTAPAPAVAPTATTAPAVNSLAPPPGVARVYLQNFAGGEYYIDFGDGSGQIKVDPGTENLFHDVPPGRLTPSISLFGGATANADFQIGPDQSWVILLDSDGTTIRWGQVYP
jgi:hypothetical protein